MATEFCETCQPLVDAQRDVWIKGELQAERRHKAVLQRCAVRGVITAWTKIRGQRLRGALSVWSQRLASDLVKAQVKKQCIDTVLSHQYTDTRLWAASTED